jgi:polyribonucleotide nucleotidyltransferase
VVNVGDQVKVKVIGFDERGKVKLSMRVVDQATGEDITEKVGAKPGRGDGRDRPGHRERREQPPVETVPAEVAEQPVIGE